MSLQFTDTRTGEQKAWAMIQPQPQDELTEAIEHGVARKAEIERLTHETECGWLFVGYLTTKYHVDKPFISKRTGMKLGRAMKDFADWCDEFHFDHLPAHPYIVAQFLDEKIEAKATRPEIKALADAISYAHTRVWLSDPTKDSLVRAVIQRKLRPEIKNTKGLED